MTSRARSRSHGTLDALERWRSCRKSKNDRARPRTVAQVVDAYIDVHRPRARAEMDYYASLPSTKEAVRRAARAERPDGKRHDHQTRITRRALRECERKLERLNFSRLASFDDLFEMLREVMEPIHGIGPLMIYDTGTRIGAKLGLEPKFVYLHAGTREGARNLGLRGQNGRLAKSDLPIEFRRIRPREIEDCLCIYADVLGR